MLNLKEKSKIFAEFAFSALVLVFAILALALLFTGCESGVNPDVYANETYTVKYMDGEKEVYSATVKRFGYAENLPMDDKQDYTFCFWEYGGEPFSFSKPVTDNLVLNAKWELKVHSVLFYFEGEEVARRDYTAMTKDVELPLVPEKRGYAGAWEEFNLDGEDIIVNAVYTPVQYSVKFLFKGELLETLSYTVEDKVIVPPELPEKEGYAITWETFTLTEGDIEVHAVIERVAYFARFYIDGNLFATVSFHPAATNIDVPEIPYRKGYSGEWEQFVVAPTDLNINAEYKLITYYIRFYDGEIFLEEIPFNILTESIDEPDLPEKAGYFISWESYNLDCADAEVKAIYTPIIYYARFYDGQICVQKVPFTVETEKIILPPVPEKDGFFSCWENFRISCNNMEIHVEYTAIPNYNYLVFDPCEGGYMLSGISIDCDEVYVPATFAGMPVLMVKENAFVNSKIEKITFAGNVREIGVRAFAGCSLLNKVIFAEGLEIIRANAFDTCALSEMYLPNSLKIIERYAFQNCNGLKEVEIPDGTEEIGEGAFNRCINLITVKIGEGVKYIDVYAFRLCPLTSLEFKQQDGWYSYDPEISAEKEYNNMCEFTDSAECARKLSEEYYLIFFRNI